MAKNVLYRVLVGLNYPPNDTRAEAGDVISDLPSKAVADLLAIGAIESIDAKSEVVVEPSEPVIEVVEFESVEEVE
jgi:hypothetical protein